MAELRVTTIDNRPGGDGEPHTDVVDPETELGQTILGLNQREEEGIIRSFKDQLAAGATTPQTMIAAIESYTAMWEGRRAFTWLNAYRDELLRELAP